MLLLKSNTFARPYQSGPGKCFIRAKVLLLKITLSPRAGESEPVGAGCFGSLEPETLEKNKESEPLEKKSQEPEPLKICQLPSPAFALIKSNTFALMKSYTSKK